MLPQGCLSVPNESRRQDSTPPGSPSGSIADDSIETIRLVIADDHSLFRESLARVLGQRDGFEVVGVAATADEAVAAVSRHHPDIALLDVAMPGGGIEAIRVIRDRCPQTMVVMLSAYGYEHYVASSLRAGAVGYITKTASMDYLCAALRMIRSGEIVCDFDARSTASYSDHSMTMGFGEPPGPKSAKLNPRELDILRAVARGLGNRAIAAELSISERTVQAHLVNAFGKLGVRTRTAAVMRCVSSGLIEARGPGE